MPARRPRFRLDPLEDRLAPAVITVNDPGVEQPESDPFEENAPDDGDFRPNEHDFQGATDSGKITLVSALIQARDGDEIRFAGPMTISLFGSTAPPSRPGRMGFVNGQIGTSAAVTIVGRPDVEVRGRLALGSGSTVRGLHVRNVMTNTFETGGLILQSNCTVVDCTVSASTGILVGSGSGTVIRDTRVGTTPSGMADATGPTAGISFLGDRNEIRNCVIAGNAGNVNISFTGRGNKVFGSKIGLNAAGTAILGPNSVGVLADGPDSVIGGTGAGERNLIGGNSLSGVTVTTRASNLRLVNNFIGLAANGRTAVGNGSGIFVTKASGVTIGTAAAGEENIVSGNLTGIEVRDSTNVRVIRTVVGLSRDRTRAVFNGNGIEVIGSKDVRIGGVGLGNTVAGNVIDGIVVRDSRRTQVVGNFVGTDSSGTRAGLGNLNVGVALVQATDTTVGGSTSAAANVIVSNRAGGVLVTGGSGNKIWGNPIGTDKGLSADLPNGGIGVAVAANATGTQIGDTAAGTGNTIVGQSGEGIRIGQSSGTRVRGNTLGVLPNGTRRPNAVGVRVSDGAADVMIGGTGQNDPNTIAGNTGDGVRVVRAGAGVVIAGNAIGTRRGRTETLGNGGNGVSITGGVGVLVGGTEAAARNVILDSAGAGVQLTLGTGHNVWGNQIGSSDGPPRGNLPGEKFGNRGGGVHIVSGDRHQIGRPSADGFSNRLAANAGANLLIAGGDEHVVVNNLLTGSGNGIAVTDGERHRIGGDGEGDGNTIIGPSGNGIHLAGTTAAGPTDVRFVRNTVADAPGAAVLITSSPFNVIRGNTLRDSATSAGSGGTVALVGLITQGTTIERNRITSGASAVPEIAVLNGANGTRILSNTVRAAGTADVLVGGSAFANALLSNSIAGANSPGRIRLEGGGNGGFAPTVRFGSVTQADGKRMFEIALPRTLPARTNYIVQVFSNTPGGQRLVAEAELAGGGMVTLPDVPGLGVNLVATVTDTSSGNTSAFLMSEGVRTRPRIGRGMAVPGSVGNALLVDLVRDLSIEGSPPPTVSVIGELPPGVTFDPGTNVLSGTPAAGSAGTYMLTVRAENAEGTAEAEIELVVSDPAGNTAPTLSDLPNLAAPPTGPIAFTVGDAETPAGDLAVTVQSSDLALVPADGLVLGGSGANRTLTVTPAAGATGTATITLTVTDAGGRTATDTFDLTVPVTSPPPPPTAPRPALVGFPQFAVGSADGTVRLLNPDRTERTAFAPFPGFAGEVRTAAADLTGDGVAEVIAGTGPGRPTRVVVRDGATGEELFAVDPFEPAFTGGVYVAAGDFDGDGKADLVITPDEGGGPRVDVYSGNGFGKLASFLGIDDPDFRGGARAGTGDLNGDGTADLIVVAGFGGGPRVAGFDGKSIGGTPERLFGDFFAFETALRNGVFVTAGDIDGDGFAELIAGGGPGGGPRVTAFSGRELMENRQTPVLNFFAGDTNNRGGVRVAVKDLDGDARADLLAGAGSGAGSRVTAYLGAAGGPAGVPAAAFDFDAFAGSTAGVFVG